LYKQFSFLEERLEELQYWGLFLIDEYKCSTFTKHLSRHQIWEIAQTLPPKKDWTKSSFDQLRDSLKIKYCISGRELSNAIDIIKSHYEFGPMIDENPALLFMRTAGPRPGPAPRL
jgi:hypothetical protein